METLAILVADLDGCLESPTGVPLAMLHSGRRHDASQHWLCLLDEERKSEHRARQVIQQAIEAELSALLERFENVKTLHGQPAVVRNGYLPEREVQPRQKKLAA